MELAAGDNAAADAGAHGEVDDIGFAFGAAEEPLGEDAGVGVVVHEDGHAEAGDEVVADGHGVP